MPTDSAILIFWYSCFRTLFHSRLPGTLALIVFWFPLLLCSLSHRYKSCGKDASSGLGSHDFWSLRSLYPVMKMFSCMDRRTQYIQLEQGLDLSLCKNSVYNKKQINKTPAAECASLFIKGLLYTWVQTSSNEVKSLVWKYKKQAVYYGNNPN